MKKITKMFRANIILFTVITLGVFIVFAPFLFLQRPFILLNDQDMQFKLYYIEWIRLVKDFLAHGELPFYSWYKFLGSDFYSSSALYTIGDFFLPMLLIPNNINFGLFIETLLLVYISAFTFKYYLFKLGITKQFSLLVFPVIYAFSGWAILFIGNYMFHRFYAVLPLLYAGVELWFSKKNRLLFLFSVFILFMQNHYLMFPITLTLPLYFLFSYYKNTIIKSVINFTKDAVQLIYTYLIGIMMSAILIIPAFLNIIENKRIGNIGEISLFWELRVWIGYFFSFISGSFPIYTEIPNMFQSGYNGHAYWYSLFSTGITIFILLGSIFSKQKKHRIISLVYLIVMFLIMFILPVNSIFHGFSEPSMRISIVFLFGSMSLSAYLLEDINPKLIFKGALFYSSLAVPIAFLTVWSGIFVPSKHMFQSIIIIVSIIVSLFIAYIYNKGFIRMTALLLIAEVIIVSALHVYYLNNSFYYYEPSLTLEYIDYFHSIDEDKMYRIYINPEHLVPTSVLNLNQSMYYRYMSTTTYDTLYEPQLNDFLKLNNIDWHIIQLNDPIVLRMLGVKYYAVFDEKELPGNEFMYVYNLDFLKVYQDINYRSFGFTYNRFIDKKSVTFPHNWLDILIVEDDDYKNMQDIISSTESIKFKVIEKSNNSIKGTITNNSKTVLFLPIPFNKGWKVFDNGIEIKPIKVQGGFLGLVLEPKKHDLHFQFIPYGFRIGFILSIIGLVLFIFEAIIMILRYIKKTRINTIDNI